MQVISNTSDTFLIVNPAYNILTGNNEVLNIVILLGANVIAFVLSSLITSVFFVSTVARCNSSGGGTKKSFTKVNDKTFMPKDSWKRYVGKELKTLLRNPIFSFQCLLPVVIMPLMLSISFLVNEQEMLNELKGNTVELANMLNSTLGLMIILLAGLFFFMFNYLAITAVSREGNDSVFMKYIPLSLSQQAFYKIILGVIVNIIITIYMIGFLIYFIPSVSLKVLGSAFVVLLLMNIYNNYVGIVRDLRKPKLGWTTEYEVIKRNLNMLYQTVTTFVQIVFVAITCAVISNVDIYTLLISIVYVALIVSKVNYIRKHEKELLNNIN
jgi:hypothetical protein